MKQTKTPVIFLRGKKVILRPLNKATDLESCLRWVNDPRTTRFLLLHRPISMVEEEEWFDKKGKDEHNIVFGIETLKGKFIGTMGLHRINWKNRTAVTGALIGDEEHRGKGHGTDAKMLLLNYAFNTLNLRKIKSGVIAFNGRSIRYLRKCGYVEEGKRAKEVYQGGEYHDELLFAVFREDWLPLWEKYKKGLKR